MRATAEWESVRAWSYGEESPPITVLQAPRRASITTLLSPLSGRSELPGSEVVQVAAHLGGASDQTRAEGCRSGAMCISFVHHRRIVTKPNRRPTQIIEWNQYLRQTDGWGTRTRTLNDGTKNRSVTITPFPSRSGASGAEAPEGGRDTRRPRAMQEPVSRLFQHTAKRRLRA